MADKKNSEKDALDALLDFDDVLDEPEAPEAVEDSKDESDAEDQKGIVAEGASTPVAASSEEDILKARIAALEAQLASPITNPTAEGRPLPESALSPEQKRIRELEDQVAKRAAAALDRLPDQFEEVRSEDTILIHVVKDGFTAQGRVWFKGQEIEFDLHGKAYQQTKDRFGRSWLEDTEDDQIRRKGEVFWRRGPWPGRDYADEAAAAAERNRNRKAPVTAF